MTSEQLAEIEARAAAATAGPWFREEDCGPTVYDADEGARCVIARCDRGDGSADAAFVAAARADVPALLAEVRRLRAALVSMECRAQTAERAATSRGFG